MRRRDPRTLAIVGIALGLLMAAGLGVFALTSIHDLKGATSLRAAVTLAAVYALPYLAAIVGLWISPGLLLAAGILAVLMSVVPFFLWNLVLLPSGLMVLVAASRARTIGSPPPRPDIRTGPRRASA